MGNRAKYGLLVCRSFDLHWCNACEPTVGEQQPTGFLVDRFAFDEVIVCRNVLVASYAVATLTTELDRQFGMSDTKRTISLADGSAIG